MASVDNKHRVIDAWPSAAADPAPSELTHADWAFQQLRDAILSGVLLPGTKISEPELARRFGISRGPLREAIRRLQERRLVTRVPRLGARVTSLSAAALSEIFMVREALEAMAAREAARRITDEEIRHLRSLLAVHESQFDLPDGERLPHAPDDEDLHYCIVRCSRNQTLIDLLCGDYYQLIRLHRAQQKTILGRSKRGFIEHCRIVDALADHDAELAELLMRRHVAAARQSLEADLAKAAAEGAVAGTRKRARK